MTDPQLKRTITGPQYFTLCFGTIVGVAWMVILGDLIRPAGPGGAVLGLAAGGAVIVAVGFCYAEMAALRPAAGGELAYALELFGRGPAYLVGATLALIYMAVCAFEAISVGLVANLLFPGISGPPLYTILGHEIRAGALLIGGAACLMLAMLNIRGTHLSARTQELITYGRLVLIAGFLSVAFYHAEPANLRPLFAATGGSIWLAIGGVFLTAPFLYAGFSIFATANEERAASTDPRAAGRALVLGIVAAILFYCLLILLIGGMVPWRQLVGMELPAASAFDAALDSRFFAKIVLLTALLGLVTAWNGGLIAGARILFALGRAGFAPAWLAGLHPRHRSPAAAILLITATSLAALPFGRGFIIPVVNVSAAGFALTYLVTCLAVLKLRRSEPDLPRPFAVPGGAAMARAAALGSAGILCVAWLQPLVAANGALPVEWMVMGGWFVLAAAFWPVFRRSFAH